MITITPEKEAYEPIQWELAETVAKRIGVGRRTIMGWVKAGKLPAHKLNGVWRFDPQEVDNYILRKTMVKEDSGEMDDRVKKMIGRQKLNLHNRIRKTQSSHEGGKHVST